MSSASKPACSRQGISKARTASRISGNCGIRSSGMSGRCALYSRIEIGAEGLLRLVEHHGEMGRPLLRLHVVEQLPQHVAEAEHGVDLQAVRLAGERRQRVVGAEDVARAVDQEDVVALFERTDDRRRSWRRIWRPRALRRRAWRQAICVWLAWPECGLGHRIWQRACPQRVEVSDGAKKVPRASLPENGEG